MPIENLEARPHRRMSAEKLSSRVCWSTTLGKIVLMSSVLIMPNVIASAINSILWFVLFVYFGVQIWGTYERDTGSRGSWALDNILAFMGVILGLILMTQGWFWALYASDHHQIIMKCTLIGALDLGSGLYATQRIAGATKERDETKS